MRSVTTNIYLSNLSTLLSHRFYYRYCYLMEIQKRIYSNTTTGVKCGQEHQDAVFDSESGGQNKGVNWVCIQSFIVVRHSCINLAQASALEVVNLIEYIKLGDITLRTEIHYDPDPRTTVVNDDKELVESAFGLKSSPKYIYIHTYIHVYKHTW